MEKSTTKEKNTKPFNKKENHQKTLNYKQAGSTVSQKKGRSLMLNIDLSLSSKVREWSYSLLHR